MSAVPAGAVPASKIQQARSVKAQVERLDHQAEVAAERYNEANATYKKLNKQKRSAEKELRKVKKRLGTVQKHLNTRANNMYREGPMGFTQVLLGAESFEEFASRLDLLRGLNESDAEAAAELKALRAQAKAAAKTLATKTAAAKKQKQAMDANRRTINAKLAARKSALRGLESEIAALERAEEAARQRASTVSSSVRGGNRRFPPPTRAPRTELVSIAKRYLGAPYRWAASGPNAFDCSGFTMFVYRQVGVSLPHSSRAQIHRGERVSRSDLQPGDLVFFGSPIHHVGMYVGGGQMIHAPHTGDVVKISSINRSDYAGACRP